MSLQQFASRMGPDLELTPDGTGIVRPASLQHLQEIVRVAGATNLPMLVAGRGARLGWGNPLKQDPLQIKTDKLVELLDCSPADMVVQAQAGMTLQELNMHLASCGQVLPLEVPRPSETTLGGLVSAAPLSAVRAGYGQVRDWLIGLEVVSPDADHLRIGGKVVKSVAGYDMAKLYCGSLGTLGAIATVTFKVRPMPEANGMILARWQDITQADLALSELQTSSLDPALGMVLLEGDEVALVVGYDGSFETVEWQLREGLRQFERLQAVSLAQIRGSEAMVERVALAARLEGELDASWVLRVSLLPSDLLVFWRQVRDLASSQDLTLSGVALAHTGSLWLSLHEHAGAPAISPAFIEQVRALARSLIGHLQIERMPCEMAGTLDAIALPASTRRLMQRIKERLDPRDLFAPGRFGLEDWKVTHG